MPALGCEIFARQQLKISLPEQRAEDYTSEIPLYAHTAIYIIKNICLASHFPNLLMLNMQLKLLSVSTYGGQMN